MRVYIFLLYAMYKRAVNKTVQTKTLQQLLSSATHNMNKYPAAVYFGNTELDK